MSLLDKYALFYNAWLNAVAAHGRFISIEEALGYLRENPGGTVFLAHGYRDACDTIAEQVWEGTQ